VAPTRPSNETKSSLKRQEPFEVDRKLSRLGLDGGAGRQKSSAHKRIPTQRKGILAGERNLVRGAQDLLAERGRSHELLRQYP